MKVEVDAEDLDNLLEIAMLAAHLLIRAPGEMHRIVGAQLLDVMRVDFGAVRACPSCGTTEPESSGFHQSQCITREDA